MTGLNQPNSATDKPLHQLSSENRPVGRNLPSSMGTNSSQQMNQSLLQLSDGPRPEGLENRRSFPSATVTSDSQQMSKNEEPFSEPPSAKRLRLCTATNGSQQTNTEETLTSSDNQLQPSFSTQIETVVSVVPVQSSDEMCTRESLTQNVMSVHQNRPPIEVPIVYIDEPLQMERPAFAERIKMPVPLEEIKEELDDEMEWESFDEKENNDPNTD